MLPDVFNAVCLQVYQQLEPYLDSSLQITFGDPQDDPETPEWNGPPLLAVFEGGDEGICALHAELTPRWAEQYALNVNAAFEQFNQG